MTIVLVILILLALLAIGVPVGFAMGISGAFGLYLFGGFPLMLGILDTTPLTTVGSYELVTIPMFLLMAELVMVSGIADDLFIAASAWLGRQRGGLGIATALTGAAFGAICGSSTATAATLSATSLPSMIKQGYKPDMAAGVVAISGTLAMLIPPSVALIVYGLLAQVSIGKLLIAGIMPAVLVTLVISLTVWFLAWQDPTRAPLSQPISFREKLFLFRKVWPMLLLFGVVTVTIYTGIATPTEASGIGAFGALLIAIFRGRGTRSILWKAFRRAAHSSCMIAMILLGAFIFGYFITVSQLTHDLIGWIGTLEVSRWWIIVILLIGYICLGAFMDQMAILVLTVPVVLPLIISLGFDPIWFGIIKIVTAEVGMITPPIGLNCYVVARYARRPVSEVFRGAFPHFVAHFIAIAILCIFPQIILWLPSKM